METQEVIPDNPSSRTNWVGFGLVAVFVIFLLILFGYLFFNSNKKEQRQDSKKAASQDKTEKGVSSLVQIKVTKAGFVPEEVQVKKGQIVVWTNEDEKPHQVASNPHPTHELLKDLGDGDVLLKGDSISYTYKDKGTFRYHDHLNPTKFNGVVIVE